MIQLGFQHSRKTERPQAENESAMVANMSVVSCTWEQRVLLDAAGDFLMVACRRPHRTLAVRVPPVGYFKVFSQLSQN